MCGPGAKTGSMALSIIGRLLTERFGSDWLARQKHDSEQIRHELVHRFGFRLDMTVM